MKERYEQLATYIMEKVFTFAALAPGRIAAAQDAVVARFSRRRLQSLEMPKIQEPARLVIEDHWRKVTGVISGAIMRCQQIEALQAAASRQIDSADYALQHLWRDLAFAMPVPADGSELRALLAEASKLSTSSRESAGKKALAA